MTVRRSDVAALSGVSTAVVSYVVNGGPRNVSDEKRARVLAAMEQLGYRPNAVARSLRTRRSMTLGLVMPSLTDPFYAELARAVEHHAFLAGYAVLIADTADDSAKQRWYLESFVDRRLDGVLVLTPDPSGIDELERQTIPWIVIDNGDRSPGASPTISVDDRAGGALGAGHLLEHGYRSIACVTNALPFAREREAGWRHALESAGVTPDRSLIWDADLDRRSAHQVAMAMIPATRPEAIFCTTDEQALGVARAIRDLGWECPGDIALVGFDGIPVGAYVSPGLTTVAQPYDEMGGLAVRHLLDRIGGAGPLERSSTLPGSLVLRGSCGCPDPIPA